MRTKSVDWPERKHESKTERTCVLCERDIKPDSKVREVLLVDGGNAAVHRDDWHMADEDAGDYLGVHLIGPTCARRRIGLKFSRPEELTRTGADEGGDVECISCGNHFYSAESPDFAVVCRPCFTKPGLGPVAVV